MVRAWLGRVIVGLILVASLPMANATAEPIRCYPKLDNFVLFIDQSSSMYQRHAETGDVKEVMAKEAARQLVSTIPDTHLGSLFAFAPFETIAPPATLWRRSIAAGIERIPDALRITPLRTTPMADGVDALDKAAGWQKGRTDVIMLSDGGDNGYGDPIAAARAMVAAHPGCASTSSRSPTATTDARSTTRWPTSGRDVS